MGQKATDDFLLELQAEEPDAPQVEDVPYEWPDWSGYLRTAWNTLRDDRFYGAMGGMGRIYYEAATLYAEKRSIPEEPFLTFLYAMDEVFMSVCAEKEKERQEAAKTE